MEIFSRHEFARILQEFNPILAGAMFAKAFHAAISGRGNWKMITALLPALQPEIFDPGVRAARLANEGTWLNTLLQARLDVSPQLAALDPLSIESTDNATYEQLVESNNSSELPAEPAKKPQRTRGKAKKKASEPSPRS